MKPEERTELDELEREERLIELKAKKARRDWNEALRVVARKANAEKDAPVSRPSELEPWKIARAYRRDMEEAPGGCSAHPHSPGSVESVAHRLGISESGLYQRRRELGLDEWPPG